MAANDFRPVGTETTSWHPETGSGLVTPGWVGAAHEAAGAKLDDFLYAGQPRPAQAVTQVVTSEPATDAKPQAAVNNCPGCAARLSAIEMKMERCLACGTGLHSNSGAAVASGSDKPLTIGI